MLELTVQLGAKTSGSLASSLPLVWHRPMSAIVHAQGGQQGAHLLCSRSKQIRCPLATMVGLRWEPRPEGPPASLSRPAVEWKCCSDLQL